VDPYQAVKSPRDPRLTEAIEIVKLARRGGGS